MRILLIILLFSVNAIAQPVVYQGNAAQTTGFRGGVLADSGYYHPLIKGADTVLSGILTTGNGKEFPFTRSIFNRWVDQSGVLGLQDVLSNNPDLSIDNTIRFISNILTFRGAKLILKADTTFGEGQIMVVDNPIVYNPALSITLPYQVPTKQYVDNAVSGILAGNGLSKTGNTLKLGDLTEPTFINGNNNQYVIYNMGANSGFSRPSGLGIALATDTSIGLVGDTLNLVSLKSGLQVNLIHNPNNQLTTKNIFLPSESGTLALVSDITESSFDTTMTTTVTALTSPRFARRVRSIICDCGITYNSAWFSQVGTVITFLNGLRFYNTYKLKIDLE